MNIAVFHEVKAGGARRGANEFAKALKAFGHTVDLYVVDEKENKEEKSYYDNIFFYKFIPKAWSGGNWKVKLYKDSLEIYKLYKIHRKIANDIHKKHYDFAFIHPSQYTQAPFLLTLLSIPKIYYCQEPLRMVYETLFDETASLDPIRKGYEKMTRWIRKTIDAQNIARADKVLANSTFTKQNIKDAYTIDAVVCHMGVDTEKFAPLPIKRDIDILFIGAEHAVDGYELFQESLAYVQEDVHVTYLIRGRNWVANDVELQRYYSRAKIVICFGYKEPFGLIPLEAMASGAVVIAVDEGGYKDSVKMHKTGVLVPKEPLKIAKEINHLLKNPDILEKLSKNAIFDMKKNWQWSSSAENVLTEFSLWQKNR